MDTALAITVAIVVLLLLLAAVIAGAVFIAKGIVKITRQQILRGISNVAVGGCVLLVIFAVVIPSFVKARNTSSQQACINNLRMIDSAKEQAALAYRWEDGTNTDNPTNKVLINIDIKGNRP